jgi:hypothetical protein
MGTRKPRKRFIPGIYNFCDRWCERCRFTARCRIFDMEERDPGSPEEQDLRNAAFWKKLGRIFARTKRMLLRHAKKQGIELDLDAIKQESKRTKPCRRQTPLTLEAERYAKAVAAYMKEKQPDFLEKRDTLEGLANADIPGTDPLGQAVRINDALEVVLWYHLFIVVKLSRALKLQRDEGDALDDEEFERWDANVSAKLALLAIDRSIQAWAALRKDFPEHDDTVLDMLLSLGRLRRESEAAFPVARAFKRPGFEE